MTSHQEVSDDAVPLPERQGIQSVEIAMRVLQAIELGRGPRSLSQIAADSGMNASKVHRYLVSLCRTGMLAQSRLSGLYDLGPVLRRMGTEALRRMDEVGIASEYLPGLRDRTTHSVNLAVWGDSGPVIIRWDYGAYALPINVRVGATLPLLDSSVGRVFLAYLPDAMTRPVLEHQTEIGQPPSHGTGRVHQIRAEVRARGIASTAGGVIPGLASLAAPVLIENEVPLVISVAVPTRLADERTLTEVERELRHTTAEITAALSGAHPVIESR